MAYRVFEVRAKDAERLEAALHDDTVSRQSVSLRHARLLGLDRDTWFVHVEGSEAAMLRAEALILEFGRRAAAAEQIHTRLKNEENTAAAGLGRILEEGDTGD